MKIVVTGAAGFIGSWLADELAKRGHDVAGIDDMSGAMPESFEQRLHWKLHPADCRDLPKMLELTKGADVIYHLAAYAAEGQSVFSPIAINDINIRGMNTMLVAAVRNGIKKFIFTSSMAVYGDGIVPFHESRTPRPEDPYGLGKLYCEKMLEVFYRLHGLNYLIIRPHNVYGPRQNIADPYRNVLGIWMNRIMRGKPPIIYGDGEQTRAFSYIEDTANALANALECKGPPAIVNVGGKTPITINEACKTVLEVTGNPDMKPEHRPARPGEVKHAYCTTALSEVFLKYKDTVSFKEGVEKMWEWARQVGPMEPTWTLPLEIEKGAPDVWLKREM